MPLVLSFMFPNLKIEFTLSIESIETAEIIKTLLALLDSILTLFDPIFGKNSSLSKNFLISVSIPFIGVNGGYFPAM